MFASAIGLSSAERTRVLHELERGEQLEEEQRKSREHARMRQHGLAVEPALRTSWNIVVLAVMCGLVVGVVATLIALFALRMA
jgi:hypothetical protein